MSSTMGSATGPGTGIYRGWWVLAGLFLIYAASNGLAFHSLPLLYPELLRDFGWSEAEVTLPATVFFVVGALTSPPAGVLLDRYPARAVIAVGAVGMVACLAAYGFVTGLWQLVTLYAVLGLSLSLGGLVSNMVVVSRWFDRLRGRAVGILLMASSLGGVIFPQVMGAAIESQGWRAAVGLLAVIAALMLFVPLLFLVRERPRDFGLRADGVNPPSPASTTENAAVTGDAPVRREGAEEAATGVTLRDAVRTRLFWLLLVATAAVWFCIIALTQHQSIHLGRDLGVPGPRLATLFSFFFGASVIGKFGFGYLGDHFRKDRVLIASIAMLGVGLFLLRIADGASEGLLLAYALVAGIGFSGAFTSIQVLLARCYAGPSYGRILALLVFVDTLAGAAGTRVVGLLREATGSYAPALNLLLGVCGLAIACLLLAGFRSRSGLARAAPAA